MILGHFDASDAASFLLVAGLGVAVWAGSRKRLRPTLAGVAAALLGLALSFVHPAG